MPKIHHVGSFKCLESELKLLQRRFLPLEFLQTPLMDVLTCFKGFTSLLIELQDVSDLHMEVNRTRPDVCAEGNNQERKPAALFHGFAFSF